ncbi:hypothetical protein LSM04_001958 [Trypanosoma melophagium]|uniref:uncharacterized protein n=1 Tax=Trypanosoma melophagium TaxID=715481 RepID=UPI00351A68C1|nr:hypothetical protein LSM04_001958 [Trypanosoma melophagium]
MWRGYSPRVLGRLFEGSRFFGNAPSRVRPVETPQEFAWRQSEREVNAAVAIAVMFVVPVWLIVLSGTQEEEKREKVLQHLRQSCEGHSEGAKFVS